MQGKMSHEVSKTGGGRGAKLTERDLEILRFIVRFGTVTMEQIKAYAFWYGGGMGGVEPASDSAVYRRLRRLKSLELVKHERVLWNKPGIYRITEPGARYADVELPPARVDLSRLYHHLEVVDLSLEVLGKMESGHHWATEREVRQELLNRGRGSSGKMGSGSKTGRIPDGLLISPNGERVAIELELTQKRTDDYRKILKGYADRHRERIEQPEDDEPGAHLSDYVSSSGGIDGVVWYVESDKALERVKKVARETLNQHREPPELHFWTMSTEQIKAPRLEKYDKQVEQDREERRKAHEKARERYLTEKERYLTNLKLTNEEAGKALQEAYEQKNEGRYRVFHKALSEQEEKQAKEQALEQKRERERRDYPEFEDSAT